MSSLFYLLNIIFEYMDFTPFAILYMCLVIQSNFLERNLQSLPIITAVSVATPFFTLRFRQASMSIPKFTIDGVLPPYTGATPLGGHGSTSPYRVSPTDVVREFSFNVQRQKILHGWLSYREELRNLGLVSGYQWLDGSFIEDKEDRGEGYPNDLDVVIFSRRPEHIKDKREWEMFLHEYSEWFGHGFIKKHFMLDACFVDLDGSVNAAISTTRYYRQLFSHRRSGIWKGMLEVSQDDCHADGALKNELYLGLPEAHRC